MTRLQAIRIIIFNMSQAEFGALLGVKQTAVSNLEKRDALPMRHQRTIRTEAWKRGIAWQDRWFFTPPNTPDPIPKQESAAQAAE